MDMFEVYAEQSPASKARTFLSRPTLSKRSSSPVQVFPGPPTLAADSRTLRSLPRRGEEALG